MAADRATFGNDRRVVETAFRVRYAETDAMGIAHHTSYFVWFEVGRTEYTRAAGLPYREVEEDGVRLVVVEAHAEFKRPARYDDPVVVRTTVGEVTKATLTFRYEVRLQSDGSLLVRGYTVHAATDLDGRVQRMPDRVRTALVSTAPS
jgi:acyl-CoA thioester hydrolase